MGTTVYLIPSLLSDDEEAIKAIPQYVLDTIKRCDVFFAENEKTARRYFKKLWREMVIDNYEWHTIGKAEEEVKSVFINSIHQSKTIGIVSEAGCPCIADPGQLLVAIAQQHKAIVKPLIGPSSILLALMASGMNGQQFCFHGYLPIESGERKKKIKALEDESKLENRTQIFIETPYRNNAMLNDILASCHPQTRFCIATNLTNKSESILTQTVQQWKEQPLPQLHKIPVIFLLYASR